MPPEIEKELWDVVPTIVYFVLGLLLFGLSIKLMDLFTPFSIRKEIEEDQNTALGVMMGSVMIALAIVIAAVLK